MIPASDIYRIEETPSCFSCQLSEVLFHKLHCKASGKAVELVKSDPCDLFRQITGAES